MKDYYAILEVLPSASKDVITASYKALVKNYHPDMNHTEYAQIKIREINEAYCVLSDDVKRKAYDAERKNANGFTQQTANNRSAQDTYASYQGNERKALLQRANYLLAEGDWKNSQFCFQKMLSQNPNDVDALLGKIMIANHVKSKEQLASLKNPFDKDPAYDAIMIYGDINLVQELRRYNKDIRKRKEAEEAKREKEKANLEDVTSSRVAGVVILFFIVLIFVAIAIWK